MNLERCCRQEKIEDKEDFGVTHRPFWAGYWDPWVGLSPALTLQTLQRELSSIIVPCSCCWLPLAQKKVPFCPFSVTWEEVKNPETLSKTGRPISVSGAIFPFLVTAWSRERIPVVCLYPSVLMFPRDHSRNVLRKSLWVICSMSLAEPKYLSSAPFLAAMSSAMHGNTFQIQFISSPGKLNGLLCSKTSADILGDMGKELRQALKPQILCLHWLDHGVQTCEPSTS